mmetsp:Transcript_6214/g.25127  ORF Transcript_6214/g.25127 Transcript_6214/m.25127 type:complete len:342 (-) Transcript_6214:2506-3531(-)
MAGSVISTPWCTSYFSCRPRRMAIVASTLGSSTSTFWKRRSSAASFSTYLRYSSKVVAPMQCSSPRARAGLSILPASMAPSALPAPTMVWISSMNRMVWPSSWATSLSTPFRRSSKSPRYFAPASSSAMSSTSTRLFFRESGTSPLTMRWARPSTMAVLPTPGSPISTGLFLLRRCSTWMARRISSSRPMTGSSLPWRARSVRSSVYFLSASRWPSASALSTFWPPRTASIAASSALRVRPWPRTMPARSVLASARASRNISLAMNWSPRLPASFSAACSSATRSRPACTVWPEPLTWGRPAISPSSAAFSAGALTPARSSSARGPSSWDSIADSTWTGSI